jgi:nucleoside-diphosphate kinase
MTISDALSTIFLIYCAVSLNLIVFLHHCYRLQTLHERFQRIKQAAKIPKKQSTAKIVTSKTSIELKPTRSMQTEDTFAMIKPCAVAGGHTGSILQQILEAGFNLVAIKSHTLSKAEASEFYNEHRDKNFYEPLVEFMSSGKIVVMVLRHTDAIARFRALIGATDPVQAATGTIRQRFGLAMPQNAIHGSDGEASAKRESAFFFAGYEIL